MSLKPRSRRDRNDPFSLLLNSHARLREQLEVLAAAAAELTRNGASDDALLEVTEVSAFIDRAVARHERDEEESLFPRLRGAGLDRVIAQLEREHVDHERLHDELRQLATVCNERPLNDREAEQLTQVTRELRRIYEHHIDVEESTLFPRARERLNPDAIAAIASEMQARRGR